MLDFRTIIDEQTNQEFIETNLVGKPLLFTPQLNKGTAFTRIERKIFGLLGKLPPEVETIEQQLQRARAQFLAYSSDQKRHIYLNHLHDTNHILFYRFVSEYLEEMLPLIYTPYVGVAVKEFSHTFRQARGLYIGYPNRNHMREILRNRSNPDVDLIVVTDGEAVLGIGDQGVGSINIPIAKLMVYTLCAGINPANTLPIVLDVGTNNKKLLEDPLYLGWRNSRLCGDEYEIFIKNFIQAIKEEFPKVFLHWEDFAYRCAIKNLALSQNLLCTFNDDIQGTGAAALATILAASHVTHTELKDQRIVIFGAGAAGIGIANQIHTAMVNSGLDKQQAYRQFWLIDKPGLLTSNMDSISETQGPYVRPTSETANYNKDEDGKISLFETIKQVKPTILIGCSSVAGAFTEGVITELSKHVDQPLIMPLSNPTANAEAHPADVYAWTDGKALIATGSPFKPIIHKSQKIPVAQCNNALVFPGLGLGVIVSKSKHVSDNMMWAACHALSQYSPILTNPQGALLPSVTESKYISKKIAKAVALAAVKEGLAQVSVNEGNIDEIIQKHVWQPKYLPFRKKEK